MTPEQFAQALVHNCFRNTILEEYHKGVSPKSKVGDYTDVKVVTPYGEIPWNRLTRINDEEMKALMKDCVNKVYTYLEVIGSGEWKPNNLTVAWMTPRDWDEPEIDQAMKKVMTDSDGPK